jgi:hypothetical protein
LLDDVQDLTIAGATFGGSKPAGGGTYGTGEDEDSIRYDAVLANGYFV